MRRGDAEAQTGEGPTHQTEPSRKDLTELHQVSDEQRRLAERRVAEIAQLKLALADKDEELSRSTKRWQMGTLDHVEVMKQLTSERAQLDRCRQKCAALEESHLRQLREMQEAHRREISDVTQRFERELAQQEQRRLREISEREKRLTEELGEREEQTALRLSLHEEMFKRILRDKTARLEQERAALQEETRKRLLLQGDARGRKEPPEELRRQWGLREQQWLRQKRQLEEMLEEREMSRQWLVLASKTEIHHLWEKILHLKVRGRQMTSDVPAGERGITFLFFTIRRKIKGPRRVSGDG